MVFKIIQKSLLLYLDRAIYKDCIHIFTYLSDLSFLSCSNATFLSLQDDLRHDPASCSYKLPIHAVHIAKVPHPEFSK